MEILSCPQNSFFFYIIYVARKELKRRRPSSFYLNFICNRRRFCSFPCIFYSACPSMNRADPYSRAPFRRRIRGNAPDRYAPQPAPQSVCRRQGICIAKKALSSSPFLLHLFGGTDLDRRRHSNEPYRTDDRQKHRNAENNPKFPRAVIAV